MISAIIREQAAWMCQVAASNYGPTFWETRQMTGRGSYNLACAAVVQTLTDHPEYHWRETHAEAEALLKTGWEP